ncbi:MAG: hypothetical protein CMK07_14620 [Ponticaulis sp.]|nr:hypothetical protein [Ponticaulis sp.]
MRFARRGGKLFVILFLLLLAAKILHVMMRQDRGTRAMENAQSEQSLEQEDEETSRLRRRPKPSVACMRQTQLADYFARCETHMREQADGAACPFERPGHPDGAPKTLQAASRLAETWKTRAEDTCSKRF